MWGDADRYFTLDLARRLEAVFQQARLEIIPGAKTFVAIDEPSLVARAISRFHLEGRSAIRVSA